MGEPVDLDKVRRARHDAANAPDADCVMTVFEDGQAVEYQLWSISYRHLDKEWSVQVWATSELDARTRAARIATPTSVNQVMAMVPA